jgi:hypothetical protein
MVAWGHKRRSRRHAENHDRRISAKASHRAVAHGHDWGDSGRSRDARSLSADAWRQRVSEAGDKTIVDYRGRSEVAVTRIYTWRKCRFEDWARRPGTSCRCELLHHGQDPMDPPNTSMWREYPRLFGEVPLGMSK